MDFLEDNFLLVFVNHGLCLLQICDIIWYLGLENYLLVRADNKAN